jgi:hypothetical protein
MRLVFKTFNNIVADSRREHEGGPSAAVVERELTVRMGARETSRSDHAKPQ